MGLIEFTTKNVELQVDAKDWEEAVRKSVSILEKNNHVNTEYVEHIIQNIDEYGPYILIHPGLAIPHSRPENGVNRIGFSLLTLSTPVYFSGSDNSVEVLISFSAVDNRNHLEIIKMIVDIVEHGLIEKLPDVHSIHELNELMEEVTFSE
ncbi:PTS sugar transporter subunit IIA [Salinicoccus hispanicus]|uniref:Ascorbate-specific PTS system EIIA component n=1 Tax=Salinicoccus hispanicus TaxID=157225 RepID=A0A6N8U0M5_9STAP|nr:PTS sugar transporter subunit IIA [Salinicoccus hispanicus]MXQ51630.1 PTS transporter subunit EIIA [Salinicoccus hispanicus]